MGWDEELKQKAIAIAQVSGGAEASRATGIPPGTIRSWVHRLQHGRKSEKHDPDVATQRRTTEKQQAIEDEVKARAIEEAAGYIADQLKKLGDDLYALAAKAMQKIDVAISDPEELPKGKKNRRAKHDRDGAAWVRSLVGVLAQSIEKAQLLSGKATSRQEGQVTERRVYEVTQRIIADPESLDLAERLLLRTADRDTSAFRLDGQ